MFNVLPHDFCVYCFYPPELNNSVCFLFLFWFFLFMDIRQKQTEEFATREDNRFELRAIINRSSFFLSHCIYYIIYGTLLRTSYNSAEKTQNCPKLLQGKTRLFNYTHTYSNWLHVLLHCVSWMIVVIVFTATAADSSIVHASNMPKSQLTNKNKTLQILWKRARSM